MNSNDFHQGFDFGDPAHRAIWRITQLNRQALENPPPPPAIHAGIGATAMGALSMMQAGIQIPLVVFKPL